MDNINLEILKQAVLAHEGDLEEVLAFVLQRAYEVGKMDATAEWIEALR